ncbi:hypothetical protein [Bacillus massilinigeriensis]|uniref:hypothetical protein n=1 Tax=Bacillus mediterraneensis TaxID=1805474 RepID=UPI0008F91484|nr:hypothetical protein [Bacillus mediterraneensis]
MISNIIHKKNKELIIRYTEEKFLLIGDPEYDYKGNPIIALQYKARNVLLKNISIRAFKHAGNDIKVFGGNHHADFITPKNINVTHSSPSATRIGKDVKMVHISDVKAIALEGKYVVKADTTPSRLHGILASGYKKTTIISAESHHHIG